MLLLRAAFLEFLLCFHVIGAASFFRRLFPHESPWMAFLLPTLALLSALNFAEHFVALPVLGWLLPITMLVFGWSLFTPGGSGRGLLFPSLLFFCVFTFIFALKCSWPEISNGNEAVANFTRILGYDFGGKLPPRDVFLPPYDCGGYYSFQHYGAAILKRLFSLDVGTAYNVGFAFMLSWLCLLAAGSAHNLSGKIWISLVTMLVVMGASSGSFPFLALWGHNSDPYALSTNLNAAWDHPELNPFSALCLRTAAHPDLILEPSLINFYWSEFHSTLGGNLVAIAAVLASSEVFKVERSDGPWISLVALPLVAVATSAWFFIIVAFLSAGSLALAWHSGRRPHNLRRAVLLAGGALVLLWPAAYAVAGLDTPQHFTWTLASERTPLWMFAVQWWPVLLPWLLLCFVWSRLNVCARWLHFAVPILFLAVELFSFGDRKVTTEKLWAGIFGVGQVAFLPLLLAQRSWPLRGLGAAVAVIGVLCLGANLVHFYPHPWSNRNAALRLQGDGWVEDDPQKSRLLQVLRQMHGATILPGKAYWDYSQAAAVVAFSGNACYVAYTYNEFHYGRGGEADYRRQLDNAFYSGALPNPAAFVRGNHIDAILIWPEDAVADSLLDQYKREFSRDFFYIDCRMGGVNNAGLFVPQHPLTSSFPIGLKSSNPSRPPLAYSNR